MKAVERFRVVATGAARSAALLPTSDGVEPIPVAGVVIDQQFQLDDGSALIWMTEDSPYDEGLHIYLIDSDGRMRDVINAGAAFSPGILNIVETGENWATFTFFQNTVVYCLTIEARPRVHWLLPVGFRYGKKIAMHRLTIRRVDWRK